MSRINKDHIDKFFDYGLDLDNRTVYLNSFEIIDERESGVDANMAERFIKAIHLLETAAPNGDKPIRVIMSNPGGSEVHGMAIYDAIRSCKNHVTVTVYGDACSMGCIILQAADERILMPHAIVMFHMGYESHGDNHPEIVRKWVKFNEKYAVALDAILMERIREKHPRFKGKTFKEMNLFDTILTAQEAVELGLADKVFENE